MKEELVRMKVDHIEDDGNRLRLFPNTQPLPFEYYVIAPADINVNVGDTILYEPYGINFGWFDRIASDNSPSEG